jgi:hypothetical protein
LSTPFLISYVALWILALVSAIAVVALYQHFGNMYLTSREGRSTQGPQHGKRISELEARAFNGRVVNLPEAQPTVLVFTETSCTVCGYRRAEFARFAAEQENVALVLLCGGPDEDSIRTWAAEIPNVAVVPDVGSRRTIHYDVGITPFVVAVDREGIVRGKGLVNDYEALVLYADAALQIPDTTAVAA